MTCKHEFIGTPEGVKCIKCGYRMTAEEYGKSKKPAAKKTPAKKPAAKKGE